MTSLVDRLLPSQLWARIQAPAAAPTAESPRRRPPPWPRPQLRGRGAVYGPHLHPWNLLPAKELGCGSATTCWRRLDEWAGAGVFEQLLAAAWPPPLADRADDRLAAWLAAAAGPLRAL